MEALSYDAWKSDIISEIESQANTTAKGDRFVQLVLRHYYGLSEDDAVNATDCAGAGDRGADALYIEPGEDSEPPRALVVQGKFGTAGDDFSPYQEFGKFERALREALDGSSATDALQQCAGILQHGGSVQYVIATVNPLLNAKLHQEIEDIHLLAGRRFGEQVLIETVTLEDVYQHLVERRPGSVSVQLACQGVEVMPEVFVGAAALTDIYLMLREYAASRNNVLDSIYDHNVRKWLGKRARSVNAGIAETLKSDPRSFVAYNNGITIVCNSYQKGEGKLQLVGPQVVNGCQTTRTLFDFMENQFAGMASKLDALADAEPYRGAFLPFKLIAVRDFDSELVRNITRYSNKQNAVRGRDFLALEDDFQKLKEELAKDGYYLEVQTGEYSVLPKSVKEQFPRSRLINAFDALRFYGSAILGKPHTAFGRSGDFTPGGREFDGIMEQLTAQDLLLPWLVAQDASELGYSVRARWDASGEDHRSQTRYLFAFVFFRVAAQVMTNSTTVDLATRHELYNKIVPLREHHKTAPNDVTPYRRLLGMADSSVATFMQLAKTQNWYSDRNSFLKQSELLNESHLVMAMSGPLLGKAEVAAEISMLLAG